MPNRRIIINGDERFQIKYNRILREFIVHVTSMSRPRQFERFYLDNTNGYTSIDDARAAIERYIAGIGEFDLDGPQYTG